MRSSRVALCTSAVAFIVLTVLLVWGLNGCQVKGFAQKSIACGKTKINVSTTGVDKPAIYVCDGDKVSWKAQPGVTFVVHFDPSNCPFNPCPDISDGNDKPVKAQPAGLTVYKYTITITANGTTNTIDPHVVGGGGA